MTDERKKAAKCSSIGENEKLWQCSIYAFMNSWCKIKKKKRVSIEKC